MGPKQSKDAHSDCSGDGMNTSTGAGSGSDGNPSSGRKQKNQQVTYKGAFIGVSTPFQKPTEAMQAVNRQQTDGSTYQSSNQQSNQDNQFSAGVRKEIQRNSYLKKLGFQQSQTGETQKLIDKKVFTKDTRNTEVITANLNMGNRLEKSTTFIESNRNKLATGGLNLSGLAAAESKDDAFVNLQRERYFNQPQLARKTSADFTHKQREQMNSLKEQQKAQPRVSTIQRELMKHEMRSSHLNQVEENNGSDYFKRGPASSKKDLNSNSQIGLSHDTLSLPQDEEMKTEKKDSMTGRPISADILANIDESMFLDKVKQFSTVEVGSGNYENIDDDKEEDDQFAITQVELGKADEDDLKSAMAESVNQPQIDQTAAESKDKDGYRLETTQRTADRHRHNLMRKLAYEKIWLTPAEKPKPYETAIIFDWDDTLLCTSFINPSGVYQHVDLGTAVQQHIKLLEQTSKKMLELAVKHGRVYIITNAAEGWVEFSCQKFMPAVLPILLENVTIISARTKYESQFPNDVPKWKLYAFLETQTDLGNGNMKNILALGDSMMEIDAAQHLAMKFQKALIKTVKFREFPKPNELVKQLNLVIAKFDEIVNNHRNLTIRLEKKQQQK